MFKNIKALFLTLTIVVSVNAQNGFDSYLAKDSLYRYNSSLKILDSLLVNSSGRCDTVLNNSFGKAESITLNQLLFAAISNNPELKTIQLQIQSKNYEAEQKAYLPDPEFEFELDDIMTDFTGVGMINFYLSQMFMFPGKLALEKESVLRSKHMLESEQFEKAVEIINEVRMNYYDLYSIQWKLEVNN